MPTRPVPAAPPFDPIGWWIAGAAVAVPMAVQYGRMGFPVLVHLVVGAALPIALVVGAARSRWAVPALAWATVATAAVPWAPRGLRATLVTVAAFGLWAVATGAVRSLRDRPVDPAPARLALVPLLTASAALVVVEGFRLPTAALALAALLLGTAYVAPGFARRHGAGSASAGLVPMAVTVFATVVPAVVWEERWLRIGHWEFVLFVVALAAPALTAVRFPRRATVVAGAASATLLVALLGVTTGGAFAMCAVGGGWCLAMATGAFAPFPAEPTLRGLSLIPLIVAARWLIADNNIRIPLAGLAMAGVGLSAAVLVGDRDRPWARWSRRFEPMPLAITVIATLVPVAERMEHQEVLQLRSYTPAMVALTAMALAVAVARWWTAIPVVGAAAVALIVLLGAPVGGRMIGWTVGAALLWSAATGLAGPLTSRPVDRALTAAAAVPLIAAAISWYLDDNIGLPVAGLAAAATFVAAAHLPARRRAGRSAPSVLTDALAFTTTWSVAALPAAWRVVEHHDLQLRAQVPALVAISSVALGVARLPRRWGLPLAGASAVAIVVLVGRPEGVWIAGWSAAAAALGNLIADAVAERADAHASPTAALRRRSDALAEALRRPRDATPLRRRVEAAGTVVATRATAVATWFAEPRHPGESTAAETARGGPSGVARRYAFPVAAWAVMAYGLSTVLAVASRAWGGRGVGAAHFVPSFIRTGGRIGWGTGDYFNVAEHGYLRSEKLEAIFPGFALAIRGLHAALDGALSIEQTQVLIATLAGLATAVLLWRWMEVEEVPPAPRRVALLLFLTFPYTFMFAGIPYSDVVLLPLVLGAFILAGTGHPILAGVVGAGATFTRPNALPLIGALAVDEVDRAGALEIPPPGTPVAARLRGIRLHWRRMRPAQAGVALSIAGVAAYSIWSWVARSDPFYWQTVQAYYGHRPNSDPRTWLKTEFLYRPGEFIDNPAAAVNHAASFAVLVWGILSVRPVRRRFGRGAALYLVAMLAIAWVGPLGFAPAGRYLLPALPFMVVVAAGWLTDRRRILVPLLITFAIGSVLMAVAFAKPNFILEW